MSARSLQDILGRPITAIRELSGAADELIRQEVIGSGQPAVLRGLVNAWPAVKAGRGPAPGMVDYLRALDRGSPVDAIMTPPEAQGRVFYKDQLEGFNFVRNRLPVTAIAEQVLRYSAFPQPPAVAAQSALIRDCLPGFLTENRLTVLDEAVQPRIWLGNAITTPTHLDEWHNIACAVSGRRRFTLFPPQQIANLYIGPIDYAPTGAPMSLVELHAPDLERFPRFPLALAAAVTAELEPGDAIYIPPLWWHHVQSLASFNVLVNYWWDSDGDAPVGASSGFDSLLHAILHLRKLPEPTRDAWRALFEHYVFGSQDAVTGHIPAQRRGVLGNLSAEDDSRVRKYLAERLARKPSPSSGQK